MTTEEKLQHFYDLSIKEAQTDARQLIENHQAALDKLFAEHQETKNRQAEAELKAECDKLKRDFNKTVSSEQLKIKQQITDIQTDLKKKLFVEVKAKLEAFKTTPEYDELLFKQIKEALDFANGDEMVVYIDPSDESHLPGLTERLKTYGLVPTISKESFLGGIRAVIRSKNILIDHSFLSLMRDEKANFTFDGGICL